jgi:hypothetical protein
MYWVFEKGFFRWKAFHRTVRQPETVVMEATEEGDVIPETPEIWGYEYFLGNSKITDKLK